MSPLLPKDWNVHAWWELVFKVVTGGPFGAYDLFVNNGTRNINNLAAQQLTNQVLDHYKSDVMDDMHSNGVTKIRVSYYFGGVEAQYFVFDAVGATKTGWFSRNRLLETSYDIAALATAVGKGGEYFSIEGDIVSSSSIHRHFYVNEGYYGCSGDLGWTLIVDGPGPCSMESLPTTAVYFVNTPSYSLMPGTMADFMAVFVEKGTCISSGISTSKEYLLINETEEIQQKINAIKTNLTIPVNTTSQYHRSKTCAEDERMTSRAIGFVLGVGLISVLSALILFPDIHTLIRHAMERVCEKTGQNNLTK
uniref:Uncharacterized protein n=1 Tax=Magallana gigas TaxID=29159 RepID=K1QZA2_MAGGI